MSAENFPGIPARFMQRNQLKTTALMERTVIHKPDSRRFEIHEDGRVSYCEYRICDGCLDVTHTIVPIQLENRGIASALVKAAYDWALGEGLDIEGSCSFASSWLGRHPEYSNK